MAPALRPLQVQSLHGAIVLAKGSSAAAKVMHFLTVPWKLMFAIVPPPGMCGGFPCFFGALFMIGVQVCRVCTPLHSQLHPSAGHPT